MILADLNEDCLHEIFSCFTTPSAELFHLSLVCRRLAHIVHKHALRHIDIGTGGLLTRSTTAQQLNSLLETLQQNPCLGFRVRSTRIGPCSDDPEGAAQIDEILTYMQNVRRLEIYGFHHGPTIRQSLSFYQHNSLQNLRHATLRGGTMGELAYEILQRKSLRTFTIEYLRLGESELLNPTRKAQYEPLHEFQLSEGRLSYDWIENILTQRPAVSRLTLLRCYIGPTGNSRDGMRHPKDPPTVSFSSQKFGRSLEPTSRFLTSLTIRDKVHWWDGVDMSRMDLSSFKCLRSIEIPGDMLVGYEASPLSRDCAYRLLPRCLERIKLNFEQNTSVLVPETLESAEKAPIDRIRWITEILDHKRSSYPALKLFIAQEILQLHRRGTYEETKQVGPMFYWIPQLLAQRAEQTAVHIELWFRSHPFRVQS
ncbi:hypothetical protein M501DRAFT_1003774 [Patellaria atrata CBS 101060]|uniref:F-box domain-containing protein n=1 Tax=Patellaria atrata CBS 101060 TaxID=1346257 RepID=A0A9P4SAR2_9PEZI|nr:hypothetical protein M501DRAFT_1003774 [Patellaria atrata CBS 101060]